MNKDELGKDLGIDRADINAIRQRAVSEEFAENKDKRALILLGQYPFLIIGRIKNVISDYLLIKAEVTNVFELDGEVFRVHIDDIEVFYIENDDIPIPDIRKVGDY
ncbi:hypothetical protein [Bacillus sp. 1NLA3E]|uniref:hypothetical protein n=1 Tax=Bacillus sp. 1NLA3E TaxID=666686 RepID=UPI000247E85A|nr:hypothetical protein [Bacillus sp. 1NLA3E]AGK55892.1 hypothetical protein B1NLA3E_20770 [Bacillus sp. 1NLA3E]